MTRPALSCHTGPVAVKGSNAVKASIAGLSLASLLCCAALTTAAAAEDTKVVLGLSGWTGFAPLTLAKEAGIFKKHGLEVDLKKIPQASRHLALASGDIQCAATTVETWIVWAAAGIATTRPRSRRLAGVSRATTQAGWWFLASM